MYKILALRNPAYTQELAGLVGIEFKMQGNAYGGFYFTHESKEYWPNHFLYAPVSKKQRGV